MKDYEMSDKEFQLAPDTQKAHVNQVEATSKRGLFVIASNQGLFLVEISLRKKEIKMLKTYLQSFCIQSLSFIEPSKLLISDSSNKHLLIFDTEKNQVD